MCKINRLCLKVHPRIEQVDSYILYFLLREYELNINPKKSFNKKALKEPEATEKKNSSDTGQKFAFPNRLWILSKVIIGIDQISPVTQNVTTHLPLSLRLTLLEI